MIVSSNETSFIINVSFYVFSLLPTVQSSETLG